MSVSMTARPAPVSYVRAFQNGQMTSGGSADNYETGNTSPLRFYTIGRNGTHFFVAKCRVAPSLDFCGGVQVSSVNVEVFGEHKWDSGYRLSSPVNGSSWVECGDSNFNRIPKYDIPTADLDNFGVYSLAHGVVAYCHSTSRNGLIYQDRKGGLLCKMGYYIARLTVGVSNLGQLTLPQCYGVTQPLPYKEDNTFRWKRTQTIDPSWVMDATRQHVEFFNKNSENTVVNGTVKYAGGYYHRNEAQLDERLNEETGEYEYEQSGWGRESMPNRPNVEYDITEEEQRFLVDDAVCYMQRTYWNCG